MRQLFCHEESLKRKVTSQTLDVEKRQSGAYNSKFEKYLLTYKAYPMLAASQRIATGKMVCISLRL